MKEYQLDAQTLCGDVLTRHIQEGVDEIRNRVIDNGSDSGSGAITITIKVNIDGGGEGARISVPEPKVKKPALKTTGQIVRFKGGVPVVDLAEDGDGNRQLPFKLVVEKD